MKEVYSKSIKEVFKELNTNEKGLSSKEASNRLKKYGPNVLKREHKISKFKIFLSQFKSFIVLILIAATLISFLIGETIDASVILVIIVFNALFGSIEALKKLTSLTSVVIRNGKQIEINSEELVPGDLLVLETGTKIPADCRLIECFDLGIEEASLTGESVPVNKTSNVVKGSSSLASQKNMCFASTIVVRGKGKAIVIDTGMKTEVGKIAKLIQETKKEITPLQKNLDKLGQRLGLLTIGICMIIFALALYKNLAHSTFTIAVHESFMIAVALAVAAIPEGLPAVVTISLALGVKNMVKKHALMRKMSSVETLGSTNIICSDKTGTLTKNEMTVRKIFCNDKIIDVTGDGYYPEGDFLIGHKQMNPKSLEQLLKIGVICNDSQINIENNKASIIGDPTEGCLLVSAKKSGLDLDEINNKNIKVDEIPFSSERKLMTSINAFGKNKIVYTKGAPEILLNICSKIEINGKVSKLTPSMKKKILNTNKKFTNSALRVLGFAYKSVSDKKYEKDLIFVGLQAMMDPPRSEVKANIIECKKAGIRVVMITGDNKDTALAIANKLGIRGNALTGEELDKLSEKQFNKIVSKISVYARVNPEHKIKIVTALKAKGNIVAMTGDGVNDAPALKKANIGIAMGITGTDVAKEASDMILTDDNFASIVSAVENGRGIYDNIKKFINYLLSSNLAEILIILAAILLGWPLPLTAIHLLWLNLVTDGLPAIALGIDPPAKKIMERKPRDPKKNIIDRKMTASIIIMGILITIATLVLFRLNIGNLAKAQTIAFTSLVIFEIVRLQIIRSHYGLNLFSNKYLILAVLSSIGLQLVVIYSPLSALFGTVPLGLRNWVNIGLMTLILITVYHSINYFFKIDEIED